MNQEDAFIEEAQEEVIHQEEQQQNSPKKSNVRFSSSEEISDGDNESSPLIGDVRSRRPLTFSHHRGQSYERAINEPWTGAYHSGSLPWYKKPSVSSVALPFPKFLSC